MRRSLHAAQIQRRQILQSLVRLTETPATAEAIRKELSQLADNVIQPAMETDLDTINSRRLGRMGMSLTESGREPINLDQQLGQIPSANAYKDYLLNAAKKDAEFKIDPISALDKMEKSTIGFLEQLGVELGMTQPGLAQYSTDQANTTLSTKASNIANNRFSAGQPSNLGSWMSAKPNETNKSATREGFATTQSNKNKSDEQQQGLEAELGTQITGWSRYIYDFIKSNFDSEITARAERILTDENNMVPLGILLILGSVLLYFIDLSS